MKSNLNINPTVLSLEASNIIHVTYIIKPKQKVLTVASGRHYSTSNSEPESFDLPLVPILTIDNLDNKDCITSYRKILKDKGGIYSFINTYFYSNSQWFNTQANVKQNSHLKASLDPWFITGFVDAEATFSSSVIKNSESRTGWRVLVAFS